MIQPTYWLINSYHNIELHNWIDENYRGIDWFIKPIKLESATPISGPGFHKVYLPVIVVWFRAGDEPDIDVKFKLMMGHIIIDHKHEEPKEHW